MKYQQQFSVSLSYPVIFTRDLFRKDARELLELFGENDPRAVLVFIDEGVAQALPGYLVRLEHWLKTNGVVTSPLPVRIVPGGEAIKNDYRLLMEVMDTILESRLCRHSCVLAVGGGAVLDAVGFAVSIAHRGLRMLRMPSTVLAQNDAGIGVKTGMNLHGGKNTIGTFAAPYAVINDAALLEGLDDQAWRDGIAEAVKVALLKDPEFFAFLEEYAEALVQRDAGAMDHLIKRCAVLHLEHIAQSGDPFESGSSRPLDFGHWAAHTLESLSAYRVSHGAAVAAGIALDACYSCRRGWLDTVDRDRILKLFRACGFPLWYPEMATRDADDQRRILQGLESFREHLGGRLTLSMLNGIGSGFEIHSADLDDMERAFMDLEQLTASEIIL